MAILIYLLLGFWGIVALLMMLVILMQRPKSEGLGAAFGGGVTENIFGAQTTNVLVKFTGWLGGMFFVLSFALSILYAHKSMRESSLSRELRKAAGTPAPMATPAASSIPRTGPASSATTSAKQPVTTAGTSPSPAMSLSPKSTPAPSAAKKP